MDARPQSGDVGGRGRSNILGKWPGALVGRGGSAGLELITRPAGYQQGQRMAQADTAADAKWKVRIADRCVGVGGR